MNRDWHFNVDAEGLANDSEVVRMAGVVSAINPSRSEREILTAFGPNRAIAVSPAANVVDLARVPLTENQMRNDINKTNTQR